ncbi:MAG: hypothetical protein RI925_1032 [Pseudomonadota bacterium]
MAQYPGYGQKRIQNPTAISHELRCYIFGIELNSLPKRNEIFLQKLIKVMKT